jgi:hypothetical protein
MKRYGQGTFAGPQQERCRVRLPIEETVETLKCPHGRTPEILFGGLKFSLL